MGREGTWVDESSTLADESVLFSCEILCERRDTRSPSACQRSVRALEVHGATKASALGGRVEATRGAWAVSIEARSVARGDAVEPAGREARGAKPETHVAAARDLV